MGLGLLLSIRHNALLPEWEDASNTWMVDYSACCYATSGKDPV